MIGTNSEDETNYASNINDIQIDSYNVNDLDDKNNLVEEISPMENQNLAPTQGAENASNNLNHVEAIPGQAPSSDFQQYPIDYPENTQNTVTNIQNGLEHKLFMNILSILLFIMFMWALACTLVLVGMPFSISRLVGDISYIYKYAPHIFFALIPVFLMSLHLLYSVFKVRKMTKNAWLITLTTYPVIIIGTIFMRMGISNMDKSMSEIAMSLGGVNVAQQGELINKFNLGSIFSLPVIIFVALLIGYKKFDKSKEEKRLSKGAVITLLIYGIIYGGFCLFFLSNAIIGSFEKPFIGYSYGEKYLGQKPVYFSYLPDGIGVDSTPGNRIGENKFIYSLNDPGTKKSLDKMIIVYEFLQKPDLGEAVKETRNGKTYYYISKLSDSTSKELSGTSRQMLTFEYENVWVSIISVKDSLVTKQELYKMAESATR